MASFDSTLIARFATGLYNVQIGNATMNWAIDAINGDRYDSVADLANELFLADFGTMSNADVAAMVIQNVNITGAAQAAEGIAYITSVLDATADADKGAALLETLNLFSTFDVASYSPFVDAFNAQISAAVAYAATPGTTDQPLDQPASTEGKVFNLSVMMDGAANIMRLTGDQAVRIDFSVNDNQIRGLDLDGDGTIANDGVENVNPTTLDDGIKFEIVDAYARNRLDETDVVNNFLGNIDYDGTGFGGDGVQTNGNIFLGGLGADRALGGIGNDFLVGGGVAAANLGQDFLSGGRNADFFFAELSFLDNTDGNDLVIRGGNTSDDAAVGNNTPQDSDWLLIEVSDDEDGTIIDLAANFDPVFNPADETLAVTTGVGQTMGGSDVENVDASGNLYGFLNGIDVALGGGGSVVDGENVGIGSSAQLWIRGSIANNILIGGFDNDLIEGRAGNDLLFGGNLNYLNNPNLLGISDNGRDELVGGDGDDNLVWEADGGIYEGGNQQDVDDVGFDTLWLTREALGTGTAAALTTDGVLRFDLGAGKVGGLTNFSGYGGADKAPSSSSSAYAGDYTSDQSNYVAGAMRTQVQDFEAVIATGLGGVDYRAAGTNDPELVFNNQQNHLAYNGDLDLRGTNNANVLYAAGGADVIEGRQGNDLLSGGEGNDDFIFQLGGAGDGVDVIHRQADANGDNIWDTDADDEVVFSRDFGLGGSSITGPSSLSVDFAAANLASPNVVASSFSVDIGGVTFAVTDLAALAAATTVAELAALANAAFQAIDSNVTVTASGTVLTITDSTPTGGRDISDTPAEGYAVSTSVTAPGTSTLGLPVFTAPGQDVAVDRLIYASYEDRSDGELVDDSSFNGSIISLGARNYAQDLVVDFSEDGTRIAESQQYAITFENVTTQDRVTIDVNGVTYSLQVGIDLDGNIQANEDGIGENQAQIQSNFLGRLTNFINSFNDQNTAAGRINAVFNGVDTLTISQVAYNGEETVFMRTPEVTLQNLSNGQPATAEVTNVSSHEVHLLDFDGRNGELNSENVLFIGDEGISRSVFETAASTGGALTGSNVVLIDGGVDTLVDVAAGTSLIAVNNTATNGALATDFTIHGDDLLIGGAGNDVITAGTGDDRVIGSAGTDSADGGKNVYAVQVLGEAKARVYVLNVWEAASVANLKSVVPELAAASITSINVINQTETGLGLTSGIYQDTLQFQQADFGANARFTVVLDNFATTGAVIGSAVQFQNGGAGRVLIDANGDGVNDLNQVTTFTNFENVRTVSGTGNAVAGMNGGQGRDTLDVSALSTTAATGGISYNLTNDGGAGQVRYSEDATSAVPTEANYEAVALVVDGVESVISGAGNDLLIIDETEANKDNSFQAGLGTDRVIYRNQYNAPVESVAQPSMVLDVLSAGNTDVISTAGRNGTTVATDQLRSVERISLEGNTANGSRENDVLDVTAYTGGIVVDYTNGQVRTDIVPGVGVQVTIDGIARLENVWADGNDTVVVASATAMSGLNGTSDNFDSDITFAHFRDFDTLTAANARVAFTDQTSAQRTDVRNEGQYTFDLSRVGGGNDVDTVDYSNATDNIAVVVRPASEVEQYVIVETVTFGDEQADQNDRIDVLLDVEQVVASRGVSILDFTGSSNVDIKFNAPNPALTVAALDRAVSTVQIADLTSAVPLERSFLEYRDAGLAAGITQNSATWNRIEGGDGGERITLASVQSTEDVDMNLRGGANEVKYNELTRSITSVLSATEFDPTDALNSGRITLTTTFQDGDGAALPGSGTHEATSYTAENGIAAGTLRVAASQDAEDTLEVQGLDGKLFLLAQQGTTDNQITVRLGANANNSVVLTGYEILQDSDSDDAYDFGALATALTGLELVDNGANDHDAIIVPNEAIGFNGAGALTINLGLLNSAVGGFNFDFDVLDITKVTTSGLTLVGTAGTTDEVVLGALSRVTTINAFESVVLTQASVAAGTSFTLNTDTSVLSQGSTNVTLGTNNISFGGLIREVALDSYGESYVADVTSGVSVTVVGGLAAEVHGGAGVDTLTGAGGNDVFRGGSGNDVMNGGIGTEVRNAQLSLGLDAGVDAAAVTLTMGVGGVVLTLNEIAGAPVDTDPSDGSLDISAGATIDQVGAALVSLVNSNLAAINAVANAFETAGGVDVPLAGATYDSVNDVISFSFVSGFDVTVGDIAIGGNDAQLVYPAIAATLTQGSDGGSNLFVFENTAAGNGVDTINNFKNDITEDVLAVSPMLGAVANFGGVANFATAGLNLAGAANVGVVFNKASLVAADIQTTAAAGKIAVENNSSAIVLTTADVDGFGDTTNSPYNVYFVTDTDATAGTTFTVTLIATVNSSAELEALDFSGANFG